MKDLHWRIFYLTLTLLTITVTIVRCDKVNNETEAAATTDQEEEDEDQKERATRSLGKISKLLFGGTYLMVQLGHMPPDHPLVKYPVPIQAAGTLNTAKVIAAVPGMNGKRTDTSYPPHVAGLPPPIAAATSSISYNELQDMYEPLVHKPYVPPEPAQPPSPAVTHLPGTFYSEGDGGKGSVVPMNPAASYETPDHSYGLYSGKDSVIQASSPEDYKSSTSGQRAVGGTTSGQSPQSPLVNMASVLKSPGSQQYPLYQMSSLLKPFKWSQSTGTQQQSVFGQTDNTVIYPPILYSGKPPKSKGFKFPRLTDFMFSTISGRSPPRQYPTSKFSAQSSFPSTTVLGSSSYSHSPSQTQADYSPTRTQDYATTQAHYSPSSSSYYSPNQYYPAPSPTPAQKEHESAYSQPYPENQHSSSSYHHDPDAPYAPSPSYDGQYVSSHSDNPHTPTPTHLPERHHSSGQSYKNENYYKPSTPAPRNPHGPPLPAYYSKPETTTVPKYSKPSSKPHKDHHHHSYYKYKGSGPPSSNKHPDYATSATDERHQFAVGSSNYPPLGVDKDSSYDSQQENAGGEPQEYAYLPVNGGYSFSPSPPVRDVYRLNGNSGPLVGYLDNYDGGDSYKPVPTQQSPRPQYSDQEHDRGYYGTEAEYPREPPQRPVEAEYMHTHSQKSDRPADYTSEPVGDHNRGPPSRFDEYGQNPQTNLEYQPGRPLPSSVPPSTYTQGPPRGRPAVEIEYPRLIPSVPVQVEHIQEPSHPNYPPDQSSRPPQLFDSPPPDIGRPNKHSPVRSHHAPKTTHKVEHIYHKSPTDSPYYDGPAHTDIRENDLKRRQGNDNKHRPSSSSHHYGKGHHNSRSNHHYSHHDRYRPYHSSKSKHHKSSSYKKASKSKSSYYTSRHKSGSNHRSKSGTHHHRYTSKGKHTSRHSSSSLAYSASRKDDFSAREVYESIRKYYEGLGYYHRPQHDFSSRTLHVSSDHKSTTSRHSNATDKYHQMAQSSSKSNSSRHHHKSNVVVLARKDPVVLTPRSALHERGSQVILHDSNHDNLPRPTAPSQFTNYASSILPRTQDVTQNSSLTAQQPSSSSSPPSVKNPSMNSYHPSVVNPGPTQSLWKPPLSSVTSGPLSNFPATSGPLLRPSGTFISPPLPAVSGISGPSGPVAISSLADTSMKTPSKVSSVPFSFSIPPQNQMLPLSQSPPPPHLRPSSVADTVVPQASIEAIVKALDVFK